MVAAPLSFLSLPRSIDRFCQVQVQKANGECGVDVLPYQPATFAYSPVVTAVNNSIGSVQGGSLLTLITQAAAFNTTQPTNNKASTGPNT